MKVNRRSIPNEFSVYDLNLNSLKNTLKKAPKRNGNLEKSNVVLNFPNGEGELVNYEIFEAPIMEESLQKNIQTSGLILEKVLVIRMLQLDLVLLHLV